MRFTPGKKKAVFSSAGRYFFMDYIFFALFSFSIIENYIQGGMIMYTYIWTDEEIVRELRKEQMVCETMMKFSINHDKYHDRWMYLEGMIYELMN